MNLYRCLSIVVLCLVNEGHCGLFSWLLGSRNELQTSENSQAPLDSSTLLASIPFELQTTDEKFLNQALEYTDLKLSELDKCHHRVIIGLRKSCAQLSEEQIAKVSVNLLNCQSAVEGRAIYPCTSEMSLKDCTKNMNSDTWNAYHIVSNRARAVCYGTRQVQFRAKTELAVNKLITTAEQQLVAMDTLQQGQDKLGKVTEDTMESISAGHRNLMLQQDMLKSAQQNIQWYVANNLRQLTREKALIAAGQKELADMTESIKEKLDVAGQQLVDQEVDRKKNHDEILRDLSELQLKASSAWEKIENSTQKILSQHADSAEQYQLALENLQRVNQSITYLLKLVDRTRSEIDEKLNWLTHIAGGTGNQMAMMLTVALHLGYFLVTAIAMSFVNAPPITRVVLLLAVPLNALNEIKKNTSLDFLSLTLVIMLSAALHWIAGFARLEWKRQDQARRLHASVPFSASRGSIGSGSAPDQRQFTSKPQSPNGRRVLANLDDSSDSSTDTTPENSRLAARQVLDSVMTSVRKSFSSFTGSKPTADESDTKDDRLGYSEDESSGSLPPIIERENSPRTGSPDPKREEKIDEVRRHLLEYMEDGPSSFTGIRRSVSRSSTPRRSNTPTLKSVCQGKIKSGLRCRRASLEGNSFCRIHIEQGALLS